MMAKAKKSERKWLSVYEQVPAIDQPVWFVTMTSDVRFRDQELEGKYNGEFGSTGVHLFRHHTGGGRYFVCRGESWAVV